MRAFTPNPFSCAARARPLGPAPTGPAPTIRMSVVVVTVSGWRAGVWCSSRTAARSRCFARPGHAAVHARERCPHAFLAGLSSKASQGPIGPNRPGTSLRHFCCASANRGECVSTDGGMLCTVPASGLGSGNARIPRARIQRANLTSACSSCGSGCAAGAGPRGRRARQA
jgi:hypothetical protein